MEEENEFKECFECAKKAGSPTLCPQCLWVRENFGKDEVEKAIKLLTEKGIITNGYNDCLIQVKTLIQEKI